jgi:hypothetical protein
VEPMEARRSGAGHRMGAPLLFGEEIVPLAEKGRVRRESMDGDHIQGVTLGWRGLYSGSSTKLSTCGAWRSLSSIRL